MWLIRAIPSSIAVVRFLHLVTAPALRPIQRVVPLIGGIDLSPIILVLILGFIQRLVIQYVWI